MPQFVFESKEDGTPLLSPIDQWQGPSPEFTFSWTDLDPKSAVAQDFIDKHFPIESALKEVLFNFSQRPRIEVYEDYLFLSLRGVNLMNNENHEDMVNLRVLLFPDRLLTLHTRELRSVNSLREAVCEEMKPHSSITVLIRLLSNLNDLIANELNEFNDQISGLEEFSIGDEILQHQEPLNSIRRALITLQKFLQPQSVVLQQLASSNLAWIKKRERHILKNLAEKMATLVGEVEHLRQRSAVVQEAIKSAQSDEMNKTMFRLTIVATLMLPLGMFAGLMGANVGGMPFADDPNGFIIMCVISLALGGGVFGLLKVMRWI